MKKNIVAENHITLAQVKLSNDWFFKHINSMPKMTGMQVMRSESSRMTPLLIPGKMYMFLYDPKFKDTLPYYDMCPLVIPFARDSTHFTGLNLHYLDYVLRFRLFKELLKVTNATNLTTETKLKYNWSTISGVAKLAPAKACVKQYLFDHLASPGFMEVPPNEWATVATLPVHKFVGASAETVWRKSAIIGR